MQGSRWGTGLLCGKPQLWDEGAVITGEWALGMRGQEHVGYREVQWCSRALWVQCEVGSTLGVAEMQRRLVGAERCREYKQGAYGAQRGAGDAVASLWGDRRVQVV